MEAYTVALEKWEQEIIEIIEILVPLDKFSAFTQQGICLIATDGSASGDMMSFAWKVVDVNGNAYFCQASPAFGKESFFRAEAYVMLSVL
eukprot:283333-Ditylum_brightwellii.AAC.1